MTADIDLALELLRQHHGNDLACEAARHLVVYLHRGGGQQQFSAHLSAQRASSQETSDLLAYIADHPEADLSVEALARRSGSRQAGVGLRPGPLPSLDRDRRRGIVLS